MTSNLHKLVYCSHNLIRGDHAEVTAELQNILAKSRENNPRREITGALLYNAGNFAQVLEGPLSSIEQAFETIQRDARHGEVTVVYSGPCAERDFPEWSMAFVGNHAADQMPQATAAFDAVFRDSLGAGEQMLSVLKDLVVREDDWLLLQAA